MYQVPIAGQLEPNLHIEIQPWPYARSDSVTTSGLGSEISDSDMRADDVLSLCGSVRYGCRSDETESLPPDDGVFTELTTTLPVAGRPRPRPSSLMGTFYSSSFLLSSQCNHYRDSSSFFFL